MVGKLYLIGTLDGDLHGPSRLRNAFDHIQPEKIAVEFPSNLDPRDTEAPFPREDIKDYLMGELAPESMEPVLQNPLHKQSAENLIEAHVEAYLDLLQELANNLFYEARSALEYREANPDCEVDFIDRPSTEEALVDRHQGALPPTEAQLPPVEKEYILQNYDFIRRHSRQTNGIYRCINGAARSARVEEDVDPLLEEAIFDAREDHLVYQIRASYQGMKGPLAVVVPPARLKSLSKKLRKCPDNLKPRPYTLNQYENGAPNFLARLYNKIRFFTL